MNPRSIRGKIAAIASQSQRPITAIEVDGIRVEFAQPTPVPAMAKAVDAARQPTPELKYVPGTRILDDRSPINPLDLILTPPTIN